MMTETQKHNALKKPKGAVLLAVLFIIMTITVMSIGFLSKSDSLLACSSNVVLRTKMDYLAESGLNHAAELIMNPQNCTSEYWTGQTKMQLDPQSSDYYDVTNTQIAPCDYQVTCRAYRQQDTLPIGQSCLQAQIRLDPAIALWSQTNLELPQSYNITGDVYTAGNLTNKGTINGDVFADSLTGSITGNCSPKSEVSLKWPDVTISDFVSRYSTLDLDWSFLPAGSYIHFHDIWQAIHKSGNLTIYESFVEIMLIVDGDLIIKSSNNTITALKNMPALFVTGNLILEPGAELTINGLAVVEGKVIQSTDDSALTVNGGLFVGQGFSNTTRDSSFKQNTGTLVGNPQLSTGYSGNAFEFDGTDDHVIIQNEAAFDFTSQITVAAWIKVDSFDTPYQAIVTKGDSAWRLQRYASTNAIEFACTGISCNQYGSVAGMKNINDQKWHHVTGVYDGSKIKIYIDGVLDAEKFAFGSINTNNYNVMIGENAERTQRHFKGLIDDVRIYNMAIDPSNIYSFIDNDIYLTANWKFNGNGADTNITAYPSKTAVKLWTEDGTEQNWSQAGGFFVKEIKRIELSL